MNTWSRMWKSYLVYKTISLASAFFIVILVLFAVAPGLETKWYPIVTNEKLIDQRFDTDGTTTLFTYSFDKRRKCAVKEVRWYLQDGDVIAPVNIFSKLPVFSRPISNNLTVTWSLAGGSKLPGTYFLSVDYDCGLPWVTHQIIGPFDLK